MLKELIHLANHLDSKGFKKEADFLDSLLSKKADWKEQLESQELELIEYSGVTESDLEKDAQYNLTKALIQMANHLDSKGLRKEADALDSIIYNKC